MFSGWNSGKLGAFLHGVYLCSYPLWILNICYIPRTLLGKREEPKEGGKINFTSCEEEEWYNISKRCTEKKIWFIAYSYNDSQQKSKVFLLLKSGQP